MIGSSIDQFKVLQTLGDSPTGSKYLAQHHQTGGRFVLHALRPELMRNEDFKQALMNEVNQLIKLEHPNIVTPTNLLEVDTQFFLVFEHVEGQTLDAMLSAARGALALDGLIRIFKDVLRGFGYAHTEGIVHRLFSPRSILVNADSEAKILGFCNVLQKVKEANLADPDRAEFAAYFSPERFNNPDTTDVRANIYSLGVLLFQMFTGRLLFEGATVFELEMSHAQNPVPNPRSLNPQLPEGMAAIILKALEKKPENRFQTALEFYRELEKIENMRRSELFQDDFIKGFGEIDGLPAPGKMDEESAEEGGSFSLDHPFGESLEEAPQYPIGTAPPEDPLQKKTVHDERLTPDMFAPPPGRGEKPKNQAAELGLEDGDATGDDSGFHFDPHGADEASGDGSYESQAEALGLEGYAPGGEATEGEGKGDESFDFGGPPEGGEAPADGGFDFGESTDGGDDQGFADFSQEQGFNLESTEAPSDQSDFDIPGADVSDWEKDFDAKVEEPTRDEMGNIDFGDLPGESLGLEDSVSDIGDGFSLGDDQSPASRAATKADFGMSEDDDIAGGFDLTASEPTVADGTQPMSFEAPPTDDAFVTDDGAFSFEPAGDASAVPDSDLPPAMPEIRRPLQKMSESLDAAEVDEPVVSAVRVKRMDKRIVLITSVLAVVAAVSLFLWFRSFQEKGRRTEELTVIQNLVASRNLDGALAEIETALARKPGAKHRAELQQLENQVKQDQAQLRDQIATLLERADEFEAQELTLVDGKNDAIGTYARILELDPNHEDAQAEIERLEQEKMAQVSMLIDEEQEVEALRILAVLSEVRPGNAEFKTQYRSLRDRLVEEKSGTLKSQINQLYSEQKFDEIPDLYAQLQDIEPKSEFLKKMKPILVDTYKTLAQNHHARQEYNRAIDNYRNALAIDPNEQKIIAILNELKEEEVRYSIEKAQLRLDRANERNDLTTMYKAANKLNELDPGNAMANSSLALVSERLDDRQREADQLVMLGQFKKAAAIYKEIYSIRGDENAKILWKKYASWTPPPGMCFIPGGKFLMGYNPDIMARPAHSVTVSPFFLDAKETTNAEFKAFVDANPQWHPDRISADKHDGNYLRHWENGAPLAEDLDKPVNFVSWFAAQAYATYKGKRLPTEAEWEFAAAGGTKGQKYWWGNYSDAKNAIYEFYPAKRPGPVGSYPPNPYGVHEILGNVSEWVQDSYAHKFYESSRNANNPVNTGPGQKVHRGGSYRSRGREITIYKRYIAEPMVCEPTIGFRCAKNAHLN